MNTTQTRDLVGDLSPDAIVRELADALCGAIRETSLEDLEKEPEEAYVDLANRLVLRLAHRQINVVPAFQYAFGQAALLVFKNFTECLKRNPTFSLNLIRNEDRFEATAVDDNGTIRAFCGKKADAYDACAHLAQVVGEGSDL